MNPCLRFFRFMLVALLGVVAATACRAAYTWPEWDRAELAETKGRVDPEAGAEVMLYSVEVDHNDIYNLSEEHYFRVKIFKAEALDEFAKIEIPYDSEGSITGVMARTIKQDGTILELGKKDVVDREVVRAGSERVRVKAFAPAGLEPGVVLEYRYVKEPVTIIAWLTLQRSIPVRRFRCRVRPAGAGYLSLSSYIFRCPENTGFTKDKKSSYSSFSHENLPAAKEEPFSPPDVETKASILLFYRAGAQGFGAEFWTKTAKELFDEGRKLNKRSKAVDAVAASIVAPSDTPEEKLRKFFDFCRTQIRNPYSDTATLTREERRKLPDIYSPADTLKHRSAGAQDINHLFAALAATTGLETRLAVVNNRAMIMARPDNVSDLTMSHRVVVVKLNGEWLFLDPGQEYVPFGLLPWPYNDTCYMVADPKEGEVKLRDGPGPDKSVRHRRADLTLDPNGTLEGQVRITYTGLWEAEEKEDLDDRTEKSREETLKDEVTALLPRAEVTDIRFENFADPIKPLKVSFQLRVPGYAERVGSRMFIQPAVFQKGAKPLFTAKTREASIVFKYRFTEVDTVLINLPEGFTPEAKSAPKSQVFGSLGSYEVVLGTGKDPRTLVYKRQLAINTMGILAQHYEPVRSLFELINGEDGHLLTLKRGGEEPVIPAATTAEKGEPAQ